MKSKYLSLIILAAGAGLSFGAFAKPQPAAGPDWQESQRTDYHGAPYTQFILTGRFVKRPHGEVTAPPSLVVNCEPSKESRWSRVGFREATLRVGTNLKIDYIEPEEIRGMSYDPKVTVRYRLDDGKEEQEEWAPGADKTSSLINKDTVRKFLGAHTVLISVNEDGAGEVEMQFDLPDPGKVSQACHLKIHRK
jgi:hypothetical protein